MLWNRCRSYALTATVRAMLDAHERIVAKQPAEKVLASWFVAAG